ncbi:MAG: Gfo/Idh/MocA family oxidoreductase [Clostridiales bacterium]|nr:Gfo/Idh/MocA family oxidoreductase [Clostridiales bacterium]
MIKMGLVGYGFMGHVHYRMMETFGEIRVMAVCDINPAQLEDLPESVAAYTDVDTMLAEADIDTVIVCCNNNQHHSVVCKCARAKKYIICEKPMALSVQELDKMMQVVEENGVHLTVHQQRRFDKDFRIIKEIYDTGKVGKVYTIQSSLYGYNGNMHDWHIYKDEGGGMLYDWGVHLIDQILWMMDGVKLKSIFADVRNVIMKECDDFFKIQFHFENNVNVELELGTYFFSDQPDWFSRHWFIGGDKGSAHCDGFDAEGCCVTTDHLLTQAPGSKPLGAEGPTRSFGKPADGLLITAPLPEVHTDHRYYFENYIAARAGREPYLVTVPQVRRTLAVMEACRKSSKLGRSVDFE